MTLSGDSVDTVTVDMSMHGFLSLSTQTERERYRYRQTERRRDRDGPRAHQPPLLGGSDSTWDLPLCSAAAVASDLMAAPTNTPCCQLRAS